MRHANGDKFTEMIQKIARLDRVNVGVAKARFAGEAKYSVPSLERLMRGGAASEGVRKRTLSAVIARKLDFSENDLFALVAAKEDEAV